MREKVDAVTAHRLCYFCLNAVRGGSTALVRRDWDGTVCLFVVHYWCGAPTDALAHGADAAAFVDVFNVFLAYCGVRQEFQPSETRVK